MSCMDRKGYWEEVMPKRALESRAQAHNDSAVEGVKQKLCYTLKRQNTYFVSLFAVIKLLLE